MNQSTSKKLTVIEAAEIMDVDPQFLRIALQQGRFSEFGVAVKMRRWVYYINAERFHAYMAGRNLDDGSERSDAV
ncbi:MAG: hypothetical protein WC125_10110 [Bacteroidales bacterium]